MKLKNGSTLKFWEEYISEALLGDKLAIKRDLSVGYFGNRRKRESQSNLSCIQLKPFITYF